MGEFLSFFRRKAVGDDGWKSDPGPYQIDPSARQQNPQLRQGEPVAPQNLLLQYLKSREETLSLYHPQWDLTNGEISSSSYSLKRDGTPICIPPSWDLVQKYAGALDNSADGYDKDLYAKGSRYFRGDQGEAEFHHVMRNLKIGGVLIGDIKSQHLLYGSELPEYTKKEFMLPNCLCQIIVKIRKKLALQNRNDRRKTDEEDFQLDFLYFNPQVGVVHFEVKNGGLAGFEKQQKKNIAILKDIFVAFCGLLMVEKDSVENLWEKYFRMSIVYAANCTNEQKRKLDAYEGLSRCIVVGPEELEKQLKSLIDAQYDMNCFTDKIFRLFLAFLAGFRPDFFICPVKCALFLQKNIFSNRVNTVNYYRKGDDENKIQNNAKTVTEFLQELKFVKNVDIDFGEYKNIYLTPQQQDAVGFFDRGGNFFPKRQFIVGPPGSGKSLVLMLKIFILGQMETRKEKKVYYWSWSGEHVRKLSFFVSRNKSKFCRKVKERNLGEEKRVASEGADVILDEEYDGSLPLSFLSSQPVDQIVAVVYTGSSGDAISKKLRGESYPIDVRKFESLGFRVTELQTVFRSTRQIQSFFHKFHPDQNKGELISGHNFDGIKVEEWIFHGEGKLKNALDERIWRLIQIEGCERGDIGLYQPSRYEKPQVINNIFHVDGELRSLEFPVMIVVAPEKYRDYLCLSRAVCHLIVFTVRPPFSPLTTTS